jgi:hypothetical protein
MSQLRSSVVMKYDSVHRWGWPMSPIRAVRFWQGQLALHTRQEWRWGPVTPGSTELLLGDTSDTGRVCL